MTHASMVGKRYSTETDQARRAVRHDVSSCLTDVTSARGVSDNISALHNLETFNDVKA